MMGLFSSKPKEDPKEEKLPLWGFRGGKDENGKREPNYILRYECACGALFRTQSALGSCKHGER